MKLNANGIDLYYEIHGEGKPLVLIAGFTCDSQLWNNLLPELSAHFKVVVFDNRGAGKSTQPTTPFTIETMADDTLELIQQLDLDKPHLLGHSMGGCIAQSIAHRYPEKISKLALCNTLIRLNAVSFWTQRFFLHLKEGGASDEVLLEGIFPWLFSANFLHNGKKSREFLANELKKPNRPTIIGFKRQLEAIASFDSSNWYSQIQSSTLVVNGEEDILCPKDSYRLAQGIKGAKLVNFPQIGHMPFAEDLPQFLQVIMEFLTSQDRSLGNE